MPPTTKMRLRNIARSSTASAPETIDLCSPHCQIVSPSVAPSVARVSAGTTPRRTTGALNRPDEQHDHDAAGQRDDGREAGPVDVRALDVGEGDDHGVPPCAGPGCTGACGCTGSAGAAAAAGAGGLAISCAGRTAALTSRSERASGSCG